MPDSATYDDKTIVAAYSSDEPPPEFPQSDRVRSAENRYIFELINKCRSRYVEITFTSASVAKLRTDAIRRAGRLGILRIDAVRQQRERVCIELSDRTTNKKMIRALR